MKYREFSSSSESPHPEFTGFRAEKKGDGARASPRTPFAREWAQITPSSLPTLANFSRAKSRSSLVWIAEIITRMRALPLGTVG